MADSKPLGTGTGAPGAGGGAAPGKGTDFTKSPSGSQPQSGGHDFLKDPKGTATGPRPTNFPAVTPRAQPTGPAPTINPDSIPAGGKLPFKDAPKATDAGGKSFKVSAAKDANMPADPAGKPSKGY